MTNADPTLVVVDTNVLVAATDTSRVAHAGATEFLNQDTRRLAISPQIVREYVAVATRPVELNGLGMSADAATTNVKQFLDDMELLREDGRTTQRLMDLVRRGSAAGRQVHDANVVAVALAHRAGAIVTGDTRHFLRFADLIVIESLDVAPA